MVCTHNVSVNTVLHHIAFWLRPDGHRDWQSTRAPLHRCTSHSKWTVECLEAGMSLSVFEHYTMSRWCGRVPDQSLPHTPLLQNTQEWGLHTAPQWSDPHMNFHWARTCWDKKDLHLQTESIWSAAQPKPGHFAFRRTTLLLVSVFAITTETAGHIGRHTFNACSGNLVSLNCS